MMNIKQNKGLFALLLLAVLTACTSEDNITTSKQLIEVGGDKLKIVINEEPFDVETTTQTRAGGVSQSIPAGTVDLGDGLEAEVSISQGTPAPKTRATVVSDGHYNIYAYDANTNQMLIGPNKKLSGNVVGGVFTPDAGSRLELEVGTYKFVCCTDGVYLDPTYGTGNMPFWGINVKKEMIGATAPITLSGDEQQIVFLMYHREARARFRITGYTNQLTNVQLVMEFWSASSHYTYLKIPTGFQGPGTAMGGLVSDTYTMPSTPTQASVTYPLANEFLSDYKYLSWLANPWEDINLRISGTIYGKTVSKTVNCRFDHNTVLKENGTNTINLKLKPTPALYLFQDGTCGALAEKGSRTPIGIVVKEKTNTEEGTAVALKDCFNHVLGIKDFTYGHFPPAGTRLFEKNNTSNYSDMASTLNDVDGYKWTWETAGSEDGTVKANDNINYTCFYAAANYDPGVETQNIGKWYLPATGEFKQLITCYGTPTITTVDERRVELGFDYINLINKGFADVGGDVMSPPFGLGYWTSSEVVFSPGGGTYNQTPVLYYDNIKKTYVVGQYAARHNNTCWIRPFVHF